MRFDVAVAVTGLLPGIEVEILGDAHIHDLGAVAGVVGISRAELVFVFGRDRGDKALRGGIRRDLHLIVHKLRLRHKDKLSEFGVCLVLFDGLVFKIDGEIVQPELAVMVFHGVVVGGVCQGFIAQTALGCIQGGVDGVAVGAGKVMIPCVHGEQDSFVGALICGPIKIGCQLVYRGNISKAERLRYRVRVAEVGV